jgi:hypothetical protein
MTLLNVEINLDKKNIFLIYCRVGKVRTFFWGFLMSGKFFDLEIDAFWKPQGLWCPTLDSHYILIGSSSMAKMCTTKREFQTLVDFYLYIFRLHNKMQHEVIYTETPYSVV